MVLLAGVGFFLVGYAALEAINRMIDALQQLLEGLVIIALVSAVIIAAVLVYKFLSRNLSNNLPKNNWPVHDKTLREIEKLERKRQLYDARLPEHLREEANKRQVEKQRELLYDPKRHSRMLEVLGTTKDVISTLKGKGK
jgi:hypothetical protein